MNNFRLKNSHVSDILVHSVNVAKISRKIGRLLNLSEKEINRVFELALYHDIGKSQIPLKILDKPGKLTKEEWSVMKTHSIHSEKIYIQIKGQTQSNIDLAKVLRNHHENWDGSGYPDGIEGEDIHIFSRIIRIADVFDAITKPRIYRPYSVQNPMKILLDMAGKELDPEIFEKSYEMLDSCLSRNPHHSHETKKEAVNQY